MPSCQLILNRLQTVLNAAARSVAGLCARLTSQTLLPVSVGFELPSESSSNRRSSSTELSKKLRLGICLIGWAALLTCRLGDDFGRQLSTNLPSVRRVLSQLVNDHLLPLVQSCGTVFQMKLHLLHHWQCFGENWKHIYFGSHIRTLLCSLFVVVLAIVVPAVIYLGHLRNCYIMSCNVNALELHRIDKS